MPNLIRIYNLNRPDDDEGSRSKQPPTKRQRSWFVAFSVLISLNVLVFCGLATFLVLVRR